MARMSDKSLGMDRAVTRRDFCQGLAVTLGTAPLLQHPLLGAMESGAGHAYPPALTGLRGSTPGSFEVAHALAREGRAFPPPARQTDATYDLIVVGAGISGLAAAWFFRREHPAANILLLDNHDDFGGHARRNEFTHRGRLVLAHGGSQSIDSPGTYSTVAARFLRDLGIHVERFHRYYDQSFHERHGLQSAMFFDSAHYGSARLVPTGARGWEVWPQDPAGVAAQLPISAAARADFTRLLTDGRDWLPGLDRAEKRARLAGMTYNAFLRDVVRVDDEVIGIIEAQPNGLWGAGTDVLPASECWRMGFPGFAGMDLGEPDGNGHGEEPYIFHFPDGNASIARMLVRELVPGIAPGTSMEDVVTASFDYGHLDRPESPARIRLNSTVVGVTQDGNEVDVGYVTGGEAHRVRGRRVVLACWHVMIPHLCPQLPESQKAALGYQVKIPLLWTNVLLNDWSALKRLAVSGIYSPKGYYSWTMLDFPVSMGDYRFGAEPSDPAVLLMIRTPNAPHRGLSAKEQYRHGRHELLSTDFAAFEYETRKQLAEMLGPGGFDPARDIGGLTVNRWPHGYAYEYAELWDPAWPAGQAPHEIARRPFGRIAIANSDAEAFAYVDGAVNAAWRAVRDLAAIP
jgi:spermidine dehydrogenase